ncbi:hypothetical protein V8G54_004069, partial [Vigna mungo]
MNMESDKEQKRGMEKEEDEWTQAPSIDRLSVCAVFVFVSVPRTITHVCCVRLILHESFSLATKTKIICLKKNYTLIPIYQLFINILSCKQIYILQPNPTDPIQPNPT